MSIECPKCHTENQEESRFCIKCATPLPSLENISAFSTETMKTTSGHLTRGTVFANRYEIIEELGKGGMGRVYRAEDKKVNEEVALKVLRPEIDADKTMIERFRNELKLARKIAHKNVCQMYDFHEDGSTHYITMEYVSGESLKSMIRMTKQLSIGTALKIAKQICQGLAEAHRLGVVHRDLKPSNIMVDKSGNARIMDFGIARFIKAKGLTRTGVMIGTPEYISPEQVDGREADQRSDIYSFGVIFYEMLTGKSPFEGDTPLSVAVKHKTETPPDPIEFNSQVSEKLSRVILKCLEKDREKRYQDVKELLSELSKIEEGLTSAERVIPQRKTVIEKTEKGSFWKKWRMAAALFAVIIVVGIGILSVRKEMPALSSGRTMLLVLPFENLGRPEDEYFADGLTEEITSRLAGLQGLGVISRTSALRYKKTDKTTKQIGEELGVDYVLEGTVRWERNGGGRGRVRITPQLICVADDTHIWSKRYDRVIEDIFSVQSEISEQVATHLDLTVLEPERKALHSKPTNNLEAYDCFLLGKEYENRGWIYSDADEFERALQMYEKATELDPEFALAYVQISNINSRTYFFGIDSSDERLAKSRTAVDRALELQPDSPDAKMALALYYYWGLLDYDRALEVIESVRKARPNFSPELLGYIQRRQGKWDQALATLKKAFELNPKYSQLAYEIGGATLSLRRYAEAKEWFDRALSINPERITPQIQKVGVPVLSKGDTKEARALLEKLPPNWLTDYMWFTLSMLERNYQDVLDRLGSMSYDTWEGQHFYFEMNLAYATVYHAKKDYSLMKSYAESARLTLEQSIREHPEDPRFHAALGLAYAYLGRKDEAIQEGNYASDLYPESKDAAFGPLYILNLAKIYTIVGEYEEAIKRLNYLLSIPSAEFLWQVVSVPLLRIDPMWDPLRNHSKFKRLLK